MMKAVLKLDLHDDRDKKKAMRKVSSLAGVDSISMDMKDKKLTVTGDIDPVHIVSKLRKLCHTDILTVGPAKEPEKKKDEAKKPEDQKKDQKPDNKNIPLEVWSGYHPNHYYYSPHLNPTYYARPVVEEDPGCVIS